MTTTKDHIRQSSWFTSNGLPDPRLECPEKKVTLSLDEYWYRFRKMLGMLNLIGKQKELLKR